MTTLTINDVSVRIRDQYLLDAASLTLEEGDFIALVGSNGAGKTSLFRAALGLLPLSSGAVAIDGAPVHEMTPRARAAKLAWLPQGDPATDDDTPSVIDFVENGRFRFGESVRARRQAALDHLARVDMEGFAERLVSELSGGERQRIAVATLLAQEAPLVLLDEPAQNLDPAQQIRLYQLIGELAREGRGVACISHDINLLAHLELERPPLVVGVAAGSIAFEARWGDPQLAGHLGDLFGVVFETHGAGHDRRLITTGVQ